MSKSTARSTFGGTVKLFRDRLGITQTQLARKVAEVGKLPCSFPTIQNIEASDEWYNARCVLDGSLFAALGTTRAKFEVAWLDGMNQFQILAPASVMASVKTVAKKLKLTTDDAVSLALREFVAARSA